MHSGSTAWLVCQDNRNTRGKWEKHSKSQGTGLSHLFLWRHHYWLAPLLQTERVCLQQERGDPRTGQVPQLRGVWQGIPEAELGGSPFLSHW